ncbi:MAG: helix-turn-helix domain-containing protein [Planctomycetota bacterium]|jgi:transcriptional regulator with XRE-family HTH domain
MPTNPTKTGTTPNAKRRPARTVVGARRPGRKRSSKRTPDDYAYVIEDGEPAYILIPIGEYEDLAKASMVEQAVAQIESGDQDLVDADDLALELAAERIARARRAAGLTQKQLGAKLKLPQSQISRIERNPDRTTVRTLKRIARALGVDVRALV